jgi:hypothetical protein
MAHEPAEIVIAALDKAIPLRKGEARAYYNYLAENNYASGTPTHTRTPRSPSAPRASVPMTRDALIAALKAMEEQEALDKAAELKHAATLMAALSPNERKALLRSVMHDAE